MTTRGKLQSLDPYLVARRCETWNAACAPVWRRQARYIPPVLLPCACLFLPFCFVTLQVVWVLRSFCVIFLLPIFALQRVLRAAPQEAQGEQDMTYRMHPPCQAATVP